MPDNHQQAVASNLKTFTKDFGEEYDKKPFIAKLSKVLPYLILAYPDYIDGAPIADSSSDFPLPKESSVFNKDKVVLDFACGTGIVTQAFIPYAKEIVGIDISAAMLSKFDERITAKGHGTSHAIDILDPKSNTAQFTGTFDFILCTIGYHHMENHVEITKKLSTFLKPDGKFFLIDFYNPDVENNDRIISENEAVRHMGGLKRLNLEATFKESGFTDIHIENVLKAQVWQEDKFIKFHCDKHTQDLLAGGSLDTKDFNGTTLYLIEINLVLAVGRKE